MNTIIPQNTLNLSVGTPLQGEQDNNQVKTLTEFKNWLIVNSCPSGVIVYLPKIKEILNSISEFKEENINAFLARKKLTGLSEKTLNTYVKAINSYLNFANINIRKPKYFKEIKKIPGFITLDILENKIMPDIEYLFEKNHLKIKTLLYFMFFTGLRKEELHNLKRENFDLKNKQIKVYIPKTKEERLIPLNDRVKNLLYTYFQTEIEKNNAFNLGEGSLDYIMKKISNNYPDLKIHNHCFRHGFNVHLKKCGVDLSDRQYLLGHA